jgi:hypothetical protein
MTVEVTQSRVAYEGNGVTVSFAVPFPFAGAADLVVVRNWGGADLPALLNIDFQVLGAAVVFLVPPPVGQRIRIKRVTARTQRTNYVPNDPFPAQTHEAALDKLTLIAQELDDGVSRAVVVRDADAGAGAMLLPPLADLEGKLLGLSGGQLVPVNPLVGTPMDTLAILHEGAQLSQVLNSSISLDPAEIITVTSSAVLDAMAINRVVVVAGAAAALTLNMPAVSAVNIGDAVLVMVAASWPGLLTLAGFPASGHLMGGQPNRILHAGETALLRFNGGGWDKLLGVTRPFAGQLTQAAVVNSAGTTWQKIFCPDTDADLEPSKPWFDAVNNCFQAPRPTIYQFHAQFWFDNIVLEAPNYGAPVGTEQGAPVDFGLTNVFDLSAIPANYRRTQLHYQQSFEALDLQWQVRCAPSSRVGPVFRCATASLTSVRAARVDAQIATRLSFAEVPEW